MTTDTEALAREALKLDGKATEGPWKRIAHGGTSTLIADRAVPSDRRIPPYAYDPTRGYCIANPFIDDKGHVRWDFVEFSHDDAAFIAISRTALPTLAREVIRLGEENERLTSELNETYVDEDGLAWSRPTAWAYFAACRALHQHKADNAALRARVERLEAALTVIAEGGFYTKLHPDEDESPEVQNAYSEGVTRGYRDQAEFARQTLEERA